MKAWNATATIAAAPETIRAILTDGARYPEWDPYAHRIEKFTAGLKARAESRHERAVGAADPHQR